MRSSLFLFGALCGSSFFVFVFQSPSLHERKSRPQNDLPNWENEEEKTRTDRQTDDRPTFLFFSLFSFFSHFPFFIFHFFSWNTPNSSQEPSISSQIDEIEHVRSGIKRSGDSIASVSRGESHHHSTGCWRCLCVCVYSCDEEVKHSRWLPAELRRHATVECPIFLPDCNDIN